MGLRRRDSLLADAEIEQANTLFKFFGTTRLKFDLEEFPDKIKTARIKLNSAREVLKDTEEALGQLEADLTLEIIMETGDNGKPKFTNESMRSAELTRRKGSDLAYQNALREAKQAKAALDTAQIELDHLSDKFTALRHVSEITQKELGLLAR